MIISIILIVLTLFLFSCNKSSNDTSISYNFRLLSDSGRYKLLSQNEVFEISADVNSVPQATKAQIKIQLPEGLTLIEGSLDWEGNLNPGKNTNLLKIKLKSSEEGFYQIKGHLISDSFRGTDANGNPALGISSIFGACVSDDVDQAKIFCKNFISKTYEPQTNPGKTEPAT